MKGRITRALYDSRLVGVLAQPEGLVATAAQTLDYQFGFKVSETWFYQFLQRSIAWYLRQLSRVPIRRGSATEPAEAPQQLPPRSDAEAPKRGIVRVSQRRGCQPRPSQPEPTELNGIECEVVVASRGALRVQAGDAPGKSAPATPSIIYYKFRVVDGTAGTVSIQ